MMTSAFFFAGFSFLLFSCVGYCLVIVMVVAVHLLWPASADHLHCMWSGP